MESETATSPVTADVQNPLFLNLEKNLKSWEAVNRRSQVWAFFTKHESSRVESTASESSSSDKEIVRCVLCHPHSTVTKVARKTGILAYSSKTGTSSLNQHLLNHHGQEKTAFDRYCEQKLVEPAPKKQKQQADMLQFVVKSKKYDSSHPSQIRFDNALVLYVARGLAPLSVVDSPEFKFLVSTADPRLNVWSRRKLTHTLLPKFSEMLQEEVVLPALQRNLAVALAFDLWMSKPAHDVFAVTAHFVDEDWQRKQICLSLFEPSDIRASALALQFRPVIENAKIQDKVIAYVKDEGSNLAKLTDVLRDHVTCDRLALGLPTTESFCFAHALNKACL